jgi:hypothetical protein
VDECPPAIDLGFVGPGAAFGARAMERAAVHGSEWVGWDHGS